MRGWILFLLIPTTLLSLLPAASAELLYFSNGGRLQHPATVRDGLVRLDTPAGRFEFPETDFRKIVPGFSPSSEWPSRARTAREGATEDRLAAAWWALENGLVPESVAMLRESHAADPKHALCGRLAALLDRLSVPAIDPETDLLLRALGVSCQTERGPHILLLHQHPPSEARERVELLEHIVTAYFLLLTWQGVEVRVPSERLTSVYLSDRTDYQTFLKSQNAGAFAGTYGYYHPTLRTVVAYDLRSSGKLKAERETLDRPTSESTGSRRRDRERRRLLFEMEYRALDHGTAAHEMIHELVVVSGLAPESSRFPQWLHEGFAAQFEVIRGGRWAGIARAHDLRLGDWRGLAEPALLPLIRDEGFGHGYRRDLYAKSWAAVFFLRKTHPDQFWSFIDLLRHPDQAARPHDIDTFRAAFGPDLKRLEKEWRESMQRISTPLEDQGPSRTDPPR